MSDMENKILQAIENLDDKFTKAIENLDNKIENLDNKFTKAIKNLDDKFESKFSNLENRFESKFKKLEGRFDVLEAPTQENTQILKSLMHSAQVNKAEHEKMDITMARIEGKVESLRKDLSTIEIVTANNYAELAKLKIAK